MSFLTLTLLICSTNPLEGGQWADVGAELPSGVKLLHRKKRWGWVIVWEETQSGQQTRTDQRSISYHTASKSQGKEDKEGSFVVKEFSSQATIPLWRASLPGRAKHLPADKW